MSAFLLKPYPLDIGSLITTNGGTNQGLLADPQPKVQWQFSVAGPWTVGLDLDLYSNKALDTFALLYHSGRTGGSWAAYGRTEAQGAPGAFYLDDPATLLWNYESWGSEPVSADGVFRDPWTHALKLLPAPVSIRWLRIYLNWPGPGNRNPFAAGVLAIGKRWQPGGALGGLDWGAGRRLGDLSTVRVLPDGGRGIWRGARVPEVRGSWSHLTDAELQELWAIQKAAGESEPLLMVEAPDTLGASVTHDRIHYGTLVGLDFFERRQSDKSRVEIRLQHWL